MKSLGFVNESNQSYLAIYRTNDFDLIDLSQKSRATALRLSFLAGQPVSLFKISPDNQFCAFLLGSSIGNIVMITTNLG